LEVVDQYAHVITLRSPVFASSCCWVSVNGVTTGKRTFTTFLSDSALLMEIVFASVDWNTVKSTTDERMVCLV
jgi:hypothetical protein